MENPDSECKQKVKKVVKLGVRYTWIVFDWLV